MDCLKCEARKLNEQIKKQRKKTIKRRAYRERKRLKEKTYTKNVGLFGEPLPFSEVIDHILQVDKKNKGGVK